jgi:hypothetical protein
MKNVIERKNMKQSPIGVEVQKEWSWFFGFSGINYAFACETKGAD